MGRGVAGESSVGGQASGKAPPSGQTENLSTAPIERFDAQFAPFRADERDFSQVCKQHSLKVSFLTYYNIIFFRVLPPSPLNYFLSVPAA